MPIARFQMPDGRIARFQVPEGTTPEQAQAQFQEMVKSGRIGRQRMTPEQQEEQRQGFIREEMKRLAAQQSPLEAGLIAAGRGLTSVGRGLGIVEGPTETEQAGIEALREESPIATTVGEVAGQAAPFLAPGLGVAGLAGRGAQIAGATALGAAEGGIIARGEGADVGEQLYAAGIGGTVAGALELALPVVGRIGGKVVRRVLGRSPKGAVVDAQGRPSKELVNALSEQGQTFDDLIEQAKLELKGKAVEPREAARKAFLESQGLDPTQAQITRNAADFQIQQEAAITSSVVRDALEKQEAVLTSRFNDQILKTGGEANLPTSSVVDALTEKATKLDQEIGDLYRAARSAAPGEKNVKFNSLSTKLKELKGSDRRAGGNISAIISDMKAKGIVDNELNLSGLATVETAEEIRKLANELYDPQNGFGNMLLRQIKDALDDDVFEASGKDFFQQARKAKADFEKELSRAKLSKFDSRKQNIVRDILENKIDPDQLVNKTVFGKSWRHEDLKQLKDYISTDEAGKRAFDDMRAEVLETIKEKSFIGPEDANGNKALSRDKLQKTIQSIGQKRLNVLFSPEEQKFLKDMLEVAKLRKPVRGTAVDMGPSAQAVARLEEKLQKIPLMSTLVDVVDFDARGRAVVKGAPRRVEPLSPSAAQARQALTLPAVAAAQQEQQ